MPELTAASLPDWLPAAVRHYLHHTEDGTSFRALARREGLHPSTILRQVRRFESRREDPLMDEALSAVSRRALQSTDDPARKEDQPMSVHPRNSSAAPKAEICDEQSLEREGRRILRRLAEPGAVMAIAPEMDKAVVLRDFPDGRSLRTGVLDRSVAQAFTLKEWIACRKVGRVSTYEITSVGRAALRRMIEEEDRRRQGAAEGASFGDQHRVWGERSVMDDEGPRRVRYNMAESPVGVLGRRRDRDGKPFLEAELVEAAERLREDFELAQMGPRVAQNWDRFLTGGDRGAFQPDSGIGEGPGRARGRVAAALRDLGPGLGDVALRCCCFLEGLEVAEKRMGWAARSGKIVLRIALMRLRRHYDETYGRSGPLIG
ncbi:MAG: helix-turn-helix domain containing protein [Rhodobacter sp.]|nr:helix-turn-helix domain containing protein [Rhodobacter sp.]